MTKSRIFRGETSVPYQSVQSRGDQPQAIAALSRGVKEGLRHQVLLGVTGSGKTFTMANVIRELQRPALVIAHNKTLAAQLAAEFREFFPDSAVGYFVSYYDYYQPEAYIASSDTFIEKDASINDEIDRMRHSATAWLAERRDVVIVASVSCIYGMGDPEEYSGLSISLREGQLMDREQLLTALIDIQYARNDFEFERGTFRVRGDVIEIIPAGYQEKALRVELFGDEVERISEIDTLTGTPLRHLSHVMIYPASHYATSREKLLRAIEQIEADLSDNVEYLKKEGKLLEAQRLEQRTRYDLEMMREIGYCNGIENYSRYFDGRQPGEPPFTLLDYFPEDFLLFIDEAHMTIPQIRAMYNGDRARKQSLVEYGFRLPSAFDNRPTHGIPKPGGRDLRIRRSGPYRPRSPGGGQRSGPRGSSTRWSCARLPARWTTCWEIHKVVAIGQRVLVTTSPSHGGEPDQLPAGDGRPGRIPLRWEPAAPASSIPAAGISTSWASACCGRV